MGIVSQFNNRWRHMYFQYLGFYPLNVQSNLVSPDPSNPYLSITEQSPLGTDFPHCNVAQQTENPASESGAVFYITNSVIRIVIYVSNPD